MSAPLPGTMVRLDGGRFLMGTEDPERVPGDGEDPVREVVVAPFAIDRFAVSNRRFADFVAATGYVTDAERYGWSFVFAGLLPDDFPPTRALAAAPWWRQVHGADWRHPEGPQSGVADRLDHPVVHVSHADALAFCAWARLRLPSEEEWELAARGEHRCNIWQGEFPVRNSAEDGYAGTAPVDAFAPNGFGLHNVAGNVWEWCADAFRAPSAVPGARVIRGGSYLCHASYCNRYRVAARTGTTPDSSTGHTGFRCARDA
jgi:formylglycine-generating enzyme required for sulfatase activity